MDKSEGVYIKKKERNKIIWMRGKIFKINRG